MKHPNPLRIAGWGWLVVEFSPLPKSFGIQAIHSVGGIVYDALANFPSFVNLK